MPGDTAGRVFRFGIFEANETAGELRKNGVRIKLHSQPFQVLVMLLERPFDVVTREEMRRRLWGEDTFVDFDHGLNTAINKIREALNDSASQPRYVETVSGKGYRFIASVTQRAPFSNGSEKLIAASEAAATRVGIATTSPVATSRRTEPPKQSVIEDQSVVEDVLVAPPGTLLTASHELPVAPRLLVRTLLLLIQAMYMAFYLGALANIQEIHDIFLDARLLPGAALTPLLLTSAAVLIPVRLFIFTAVAFDFQQLPAKFRRLFPVLLPLDLLWALSPFLLVHHVSAGLALGMSTPLVYIPFAQRSLILMYEKGR